MVIRTNSFNTTLTINASKDTVAHYGEVGLVDIVSIAKTSYHEHGEASFAKIANGRIVITKDAEIGGLHAVATDDIFDNIIVAIVGNAEIPTITRDKVSIDEKDEEGVYSQYVLEVQTLNNEKEQNDDSEYVWISISVDGSGNSSATTEVATSKTELNAGTKVPTSSQSVAASSIAETAASTLKIYNVINESQLTTALAATDDNIIINIGESFEITNVALFTRSTTIYGFGHEIKGKANRIFRVTQPDLNIKIYDLTMTSICTANSDVRGISFDDISSGSSLLLDRCSISASFYVINAIPGANNLTVTIKNGTVAAGWAALNVYSNNSVFIVENSVLKGLNDKSYNESGWNDFNTITIDGNGYNGSQAGEHGFNNIVNIINSTIFASSSSGNEQSWVGLQYGAINNIIDIDGKSTIIDVFGNDQSDNYYVSYLPNSIIINGIEKLPQPNVFYTNAAANYINNELTSTSPSDAFITFFETPFTGNWLADGEGLKLTGNVKLQSNIQLNMNSGFIYLIFNGYTITGGKIVLQGTVSVISDIGTMSNVFAGNVNVTNNGNGTFTYSLVE